MTAQLTRTLRRIKLDELEVDPDNVRTSYDPEHVAELRAALVEALKNGQEYINPPVVYPVGANNYRVKSGNCRVLAAKEVVESLEVLVEDPPKSVGIKLLEQLSENVLQGGLSAMDTARAIRRLRDAEELSVGGLSDALQQRGIGHGRFWVQMHLDLTKLEVSVQAAVERGDIAARAAWELRRLTPAEQAAWTRRIVDEGMSLRTLAAALTGKPVETGTPPGGTPGSIEDLEERLRQAALALESAQTGHSGPRAEVQRNEVDRRWELIPMSVEQPPQRLAGKVRALLEHTGYQAATQREQALALEALILGGASPELCLSLAKKAEEEALNTPHPVMIALNSVRQLLEAPELLQGRLALAEFLELRMRRALASLKSAA